MIGIDINNVETPLNLSGLISGGLAIFLVAVATFLIIVLVLVLIINLVTLNEKQEKQLGIVVTAIIAVPAIFVAIFVFKYVWTQEEDEKTASATLSHLSEEYDVDFDSEAGLYPLIREDVTFVPVTFADGSFAVYDGYVVRVDENTIALAVPAGTEGTELVEWDSELALDIGLEEVSN